MQARKNKRDTEYKKECEKREEKFWYQHNGSVMLDALKQIADTPDCDGSFAIEIAQRVLDDIGEIK